MQTCKKCGGYRFNDTGVCNCQEFIVVDADGEEHKQHAVNEHDAAAKYAMHYNEDGDYALMGKSIVVEVRGPEGSKFMRVSAEQDIHYSCDEVPNAVFSGATKE